MTVRRHIMAALKANPVFSAAAATDMESLCGRVHPTRFKAGEMVLGQKDQSADVFVVQTGRLLAILYTEDGREVSYEEIRAGQLFGELAALDGKERSVSVFAIDPVTLIRVPAPVFRDFLGRSPEAALALMHEMSSRVRRLTERNFQMVVFDVEQRVRTYIVRRAEHEGLLCRNGVLSPFPTHAEIANQIGTNREEVSRTLGRLSKSGILRTGRKKIEIIDPMALLDGVLGDAPSPD